MNALKLRGCKMCGGNVLWDRNENGKCILCVRCGAVYHEGFEPLHRSSPPELVVETMVVPNIKI
jgi:hypothetical protein